MKECDWYSAIQLLKCHIMWLRAAVSLLLYIMCECGEFDCLLFNYLKDFLIFFKVTSF